MKNRFIWLTGLISFIFVWSIFYTIKNDYFLFLHDELLVLSKYDSSLSFFTNNLADFGTANTTILLVTVFDRLYYYLITLWLHLDILTSQKILYFIKIFLSIWVPFLGFKKLYSLFNQAEKQDLTVYCISLWYAFNTYTTIYWHGNGFSLTILICYILAPLAFYYFNKAILTNKVNIIDRLIFIVLIFFMSFALYLFSVFILFLFLYTLFFIINNITKSLAILKNIIVIFILFLPLLSVFLLIPYDILSSVSNANNITGGETYNQLRGGLFYPIIMWFSWGIYTVWEPRNIFTFHNYFKTLPSIFAPITLYFLILYDFLKTKKPYFKVLLFLSLIIMFFLIKGSQAPFGGIYTFLIQHVAVFRVFRSPDNKFGFGIVLIISLLLLMASQSFKKKIFVFIILIVIFIQGFLLFTGTAVKGENTPTSADRVIKVGSDYKKYIEFINSQEGKFGYVATIPPVAFANYSLGDNETHWGQDLLPKFTKYPYIYIDSYGGMNKEIFKKISLAINNGDKKSLSAFPVRFYVVRKDVLNYSSEKYEKIIENLELNFNIIFENNTFKIYENDDYKQIIYGNKIEFVKISPVEYRIKLSNLSSFAEINLLQNFNKNWNLYIDSDNARSDFKNIVYIFKKPTITNIKSDSSFNSWKVSKDEILKNVDSDLYTINGDGSINVIFTLYFKIQAVFYGLILISLTYLLIILIAIFSIKKFFLKK